jgi:hypothetical protein
MTSLILEKLWRVLNPFFSGCIISIRYHPSQKYSATDEYAINRSHVHQNLPVVFHLSMCYYKQEIGYSDFVDHPL